MAALKCSKQDDNDEEDIKAPSNAIKLGYDIKRMASAKYAFGITSGNQEMKREGKEFLRVMTIRWHTEVTRLAREVLLEKSMNKPSHLPLPGDVKDLQDNIKMSLGKLRYLRQDIQQLQERSNLRTGTIDTLQQTAMPRSSGYKVLHVYTTFNS